MSHDRYTESSRQKPKEMENLYDQLLAAIENEDLAATRQILAKGIDLNMPCADLAGAPPLFFAILKGNYTLVELLLEHGADPNYRADEPVASIYTAKPLDLARQARMLMDWDRYHSIVKLLEDFGATYEDGQIDSSELVEKSKVEAKKWQASK